MEITGTGIEDIVLLRDAVRHTRLDIEDILENGVLAETEPEYQHELAFYRELRDKHDRLADLEIELNKIVNIRSIIFCFIIITYLLFLIIIHLNNIFTI